MRLLLVLLLTGACGSSATRPSRSVRPVRAQPQPPTETPAIETPPAEPQPRPITNLDPKQIMGWVRGRSAPEVRHGDGVVTKLEAENFRDPDLEMVNLRFAVDNHRFAIEVPRALPIPFEIGTRVSFRARSVGGGPNRMVELIITAADGTLLLAANLAPDDWTIDRGKRVATERAEGYLEHRHEVVITHAGAKVKVRGWATLGDFYVWGSSGSRTLPKRQRAPVDFVGGWTDFAIVHR